MTRAFDGGRVEVLEWERGGEGGPHPTLQGAARGVSSPALSRRDTHIMVGLGGDVVGGGGHTAAAAADTQVVCGEGAKQPPSRQTSQAGPHESRHCDVAASVPAEAAHACLHQLQHGRVCFVEGHAGLTLQVQAATLAGLVREAVPDPHTLLAAAAALRPQ